MHINTDHTRYFKRDPASMKWNLSAYDDTLLSQKYPLQQFDQFFNKVRAIPLPAAKTCCSCSNKAGETENSYITKIN